MQWYVSQKGKTTGPFDEERLAMLVRWGKISRDAFICDEQLSAWIGIRRSAFARLLQAPEGDGSGGALGSDAGAGAPPGSSSGAGSERSDGEQAGSRQALGLVALSVVLAGVLMATL